MALLRNRGRVGDAARELGVSRVTLYRILSAYNMREVETPSSLGLE
jgi:transcriptional regulator of acetoin/glycerol metabolism